MTRISVMLLNVITLLSISAFAQQGTSSSSGPEVVPGEYIVKLKAMAGAAGVLSKMQNKMSLKGSFPSVNMFHLSMKPGADENSTVEELINDPDVEYIEPNYILRTVDYDENTGLGRAVEAFKDGHPPQAFGQYSAASSSYSQSNAQTKVAEAWAIESSTQNNALRPIVAIIDTGLDKNHRVFQQSQAVWVNTREIPNNGVDDDFNGYVDDVNGYNFITNNGNFADDDGHGTHVAGIVVGTSLNIFANPINETARMRIMPLKFLDANGSGTTSNAIRAIYYAVNMGAQVINNSWGGSSYSRALHEALTFAYSNRVLIASAAGNNGRNNDSTPMYPASYDVPSNISVAATSDYDYLASFSNYGATSVHVASPGVMITSTLPDDQMGSMSGTSMATPFVSGMAALAMRESPSMTGYQIKNLILANSKNFASLSGKVTTAARIDSYAMIDQAKVQSNLAASQPDYSPNYQSDARSVASESGNSGGCGLVSTVIKNGPGSGKGNTNPAGVLAGLMLLPVILWAVLRQREMAKSMDPAGRRKFARFKMESDIRVMVGDRELVGSLKTISLGGASFSADAALEKGGIVTMKIASPDGESMVEVQGQVVWSEANQAYGVQFANTEQSTLSMIQKWTTGLMKV